MNRTICFEDVKRSVLRVAHEKGRHVALALLQTWQVDRASQLPVAAWAAFLGDVEYLLFPESIHPASVMHTPSSEDRQSGVRTPVVAPVAQDKPKDGGLCDCRDRCKGECCPKGLGSKMLDILARGRAQPVSTPTLDKMERAFGNARMITSDATPAAAAWREKQQAKAELLAAEQAKRNAPLPCPAGFGYRPDQAPTGHQFGQFAKR